MENVSFQQETNIEEVFNKYFSRIYRLALQTCKSPEAAEDLTQETFLRYYQHPQYQSTGKELQYLYVIARNLCIDTYRKPSAEPLSEENMPVVFVQDDDFITVPFGSRF